MRCPFCAHEDTQVKDSRPVEENSVIRRRRQCVHCNARFTTFERIQLRELMVLKSSQQQEPFDREKLHRSLALALRKRPVSEDQVQTVVSSIVRQLESLGESTIVTSQIGEMAMAALAQLDTVAYVRYASVYKDFREANDFDAFVRALPTLPSS